MPTGAITEYVNVAQVVLYVFWVFFFALIIYLHRENKREGYPLDTASARRGAVQGFPAMPSAKQYLLPHGGTATVDGRPDTREIKAIPIGGWPGAPLEPTGNPMVDGVGPAAWATRADVPDQTFEGHAKIVPLRVATDFAVVGRDPDPRGLQVIAADGKLAGTVRDVWVDRSEAMIRYLEVQTSADGGSKVVLLPMMLAKFARMSRAPAGDRPLSERLIDGRPYEVRVASVCAHHFADAPMTKSPDQVTLLEEDRIMAYFGSGHLYALNRREPLV